MPRFGALREHEYEDREDQLWEWVNNCGTGIMGISEVPGDCFEFVMSQYERFNIPVPEAAYPIVEAAAMSPIYYIDVYDPYALFHGTSDVNLTLEWCEVAYEILDVHTGRYYEASPQYLETYKYIPYQSEEHFNHVMSHPGLESVTCEHELNDILFGEVTGESVCDIDMEARRALEAQFTMPDGTVNWDRINAFIRLAAWASYAWLVGPPSRAWRMAHLDIFYTAVTSGEAIMVDGCIIGPNNYRKLDRSPVSCFKCNIAAWCVEMCSVEGGARYICEHCLNDDIPKFGGLATCGTKRCMLTQCPHHPYHHLGSAGIQNYMREHGQLRAAADGQTATRLLTARS